MKTGKPPSWLYYFVVLTMVVAAGGYFFVVYHYSINIPFWDDYTHLKVITEIANSDSLITKIQLLFSLHNEHRIVVARLITLAALKLSGELSFVGLILFGNLSLVGIGGLLYLVFRGDSTWDRKERVVYFLPVVLLLFNLSYYEASIWAVAALSGLVVIFLAFLCLFLLLRAEGKDPIGGGSAFALGAIAAYTQGNGLFVLYVGTLVLILNKRVAGALLWGLGAGVVSYLYFYNYARPGFHADPSAVLFNLDLVVHYLLTFLGAWAKLPALIGACMLGLFAWLVYRGLYKKNPIIFSYLSFILISALAVTASRYEMGIEQALSSRYNVYSLLFFSLLYMAVLELSEGGWLASAWRRGFLLPTLLVLSLGVNGYIAAHAIEAMADHRQMLTEGLIAWWQKGEGLTHWDPEIANQIIVHAMEKEVYHPPEF